MIIEFGKRQWERLRIWGKEENETWEGEKCKQRSKPENSLSGIWSGFSFLSYLGRHLLSSQHNRKQKWTGKVENAMQWFISGIEPARKTETNQQRIINHHFLPLKTREG